ncbi:MAG: tetratricopeptide repeat protein [Mollicutes bacterium PWAP]|nr:tetratricopeptide repeat protein [Mollicutes bacterium PWAP]
MYNNKGNIYEEQKKYDKDIEDFSKSIEIGPNYTSAKELWKLIEEKKK